MVHMALFIRQEWETDISLGGWSIMGRTPDGDVVTVRKFSCLETLEEAINDLRAGLSLDAVAVKEY